MKKISTLTIVAGSSLLILLGLFIIWFARTLTSTEPPIAKLVSLTELTHTPVVFQFVQQQIIQADGSVLFDVYSINSDGSNLTFIQQLPAMAWPQSDQTIIESMGKYYGPMTSSDGNVALVIKTGIARSGWFSWFTTPQLTSVIAGKSILLWEDQIGEIVWLPDSTHILFTHDGQIGLMNVTNGNYSWITSGLGYIYINY